ncbi:hypothetical protein KR222_010827 [Zaprionus bogoriensis]|nr:hypothetical protein KR222_010827 [Zaprionus bogoriensis]
MSSHRYGGGGGGGGEGVGGAGREYYGIEVRGMHRPRIWYPDDYTFVSGCVKYLIFVLNFIFWLFGGLLAGIGIYAFMDKWQEGDGWRQLENIYDLVLNVSVVLIIAGIVVFVVSFAGCLGALRENTCLLKFYSMCLLLFFLMEMAIAIICIVFPQHMNTFLEEHFTEKIIHLYRDDPDLENLIDFAQKEFKCCGLSNAGYQDWSKNEYFNCSSPSVERCGVPYSCCVNATDIMCGYGVQQQSVAAAGKLIWTSGCIEIVRLWAERNLYTIAGFALGIALLQLLVMYLAKTLESQIDLQKSR